MTTICVSRTLRMMASDSSIWMGSSKCPTMPKMWRLKNCIVGIAGELGPGQNFVDWIARPKGRRPRGAYSALVLHRDGRLSWWHENYREQFIEEDFYAIGSGGDFALGAFEAMHDMGLPLDPRVAVRAACKRDSGSEEPIRFLRWLKVT